MKRGPASRPRHSMPHGPNEVRYQDNVVPLSSNEIKVLGALLQADAEEDRCMVRGIAARARCSTSTVHGAVTSLAAAGLVVYRPGTCATLRPAVRVVR